MVGEGIPTRGRKEGYARLDPEQVLKRLPGSGRSNRESSCTIRTYSVSKPGWCYRSYWFLATGRPIIVDASYREACDPALGAHSQLLEDKVADGEVLDLLEAALRTLHNRHHF